MLAKRADAKGRISLGNRFANQMVIIENVDRTQVLVKLATLVPADEAWLHANKPAKASVMRGIKQAASGKLSGGPDLAAGDVIAKRIRRR